MLRILIFLGIVGLLITGSVLSNDKLKNEAFNKTLRTITNPAPKPSTAPLPAVEIIATNLDVPWALAFLPNGDLFVTERTGNIKLLKKDDKTPVTIITISDVKLIGESGVHGIAVDPKFSQNYFVYVYYTYDGGSDSTLNRVVRFTYKEGQLTNKTTVVDKIPGAVFHDGGRIKFGPDNNLYIATGDATNPSLAQDKNSLAGKILRIVNSKVEMYSYGHRNPQGIAWDNTGQLWETEHGQSATDEVNKISRGANYGWPTIRGGETKSGMVNPVVQSGSTTWAPAGLAYLPSRQAGLNESLFFGGLRGLALLEAKIKDDGSLVVTEHFKNQFGRIREVIAGPDNLLYITTSNRDGRGNPANEDDKIIRVDPKKL